MCYDASLKLYFVNGMKRWHWPVKDSVGHSLWECDERKCWR